MPLRWPWTPRIPLEQLDARLKAVERVLDAKAAELEALAAEMQRGLARQRMQEARKLRKVEQVEGTNGAHLDAALLRRKGF